MSTTINVCELNMGDIRVRIDGCPLWVKKMPIQGKRRWLVIHFPRDYSIGAIPTGSIGGHRKNRGIWSTSMVLKFKKESTGMTSRSPKIDWNAIIDMVITV